MSTHTPNNKEEVRQSIIEMFHVNLMPEDKQEETINQLGKLILEAVLLRILPFMPEDDLEEYETLINTGVTPDKLFEFFLNKVPDFYNIVAEESENLREEAEQVLKNIKD